MSRPLWLVALLLVIWLAFSLATLGSPDYSADEALFAVKAFEFRSELRAGHWPSLHPVNDYVGPQDTWWALLIDGVHRFTGGWVPWNPALMRLGPFLLFALGTVSLAREMAVRSPRLALIGLVLTTFTPMAWVYSRVGWAPTWGMGLMALCWTESLRADRCGRARWWRWAGYVGLSVWAHPNFVLGALASVAPRWRQIASDLRSPRRLHLLGAALGSAVLAAPVLRNALSSLQGGAATSDWWARLVSLVDIAGGSRPLVWQMGRDAGGPTANALIATAGLGLLLWRWTLGPRQPARRAEACAVTAASLILFLSARGTHDIVHLGHERYLLPVVSAWIWLATEALDQYWTLHRWKDQAIAAALVGFAAIQGFRLAEAVSWHAAQPPTLQQASGWLQARCPRSECLALAEDFWDYWAFRFYSRDGYDLNVWGPNWRGGPVFARNGRRLAGCWHQDSSRPYRGRYDEHASFVGKGGASISVTCYAGIDAAEF